MKRFLYSACAPVSGYLLLTAWFKLIVPPVMDVPTPWGVAAIIIAIPYWVGGVVGFIFVDIASSARRFATIAGVVVAALIVSSIALSATLEIWDTAPAIWEKRIRGLRIILPMALVPTLGTALIGVAGFVLEAMSRKPGTCIPCGYDLRGLTEPRCPECGSSFDRELLTGSIERGDPPPEKVDDVNEA